MRSSTAAAFAGLLSLAFSSLVAAGTDAPRGDGPRDDGAHPDGRRDGDRHHGDGAEWHRNPSGVALTLSDTGRIDRKNPFFANLGANGRSCESCHQAAEGWSITPRGVRERFEATGGKDPIFRPVDGANSPKADVSTRAAREKAYGMLLRHGLELDEAANLVDRAIRSVLDGDARTRDLARAGEVALGTREFSDQVLQRLATPAAIGR